MQLKIGKSYRVLFVLSFERKRQYKSFFLLLILVWTWCKCHSLVFTKFRLSFNWNLDQTWWTCERWTQVKTVPIILEKSIKLDPHGMINKIPGPKAYETVGIYWTYFCSCSILHSHPRGKGAFFVWRAPILSWPRIMCSQVRMLKFLEPSREMP